MSATKRTALSTNQRLTLGISSVAVFVAIVSVIYAANANKYAKEANQIAITANALAAQALTKALPEMIVSDWDEGYFDLNLDEYPCINEFGHIMWSRKLIAYINVTNRGGQTTALIDAPKPEEVNTMYNGVHVKASFIPFYSVQHFDEWMGDAGWNPLETPIRDDAQFDTPLNLTPGETELIVLGEHVEVRIDSSIDPQELINIVLDHDWVAHLQFPLAQQKTLQADITISMPYIGTRLNAESVPLFDVCKN